MADTVPFRINYYRPILNPPVDGGFASVLAHCQKLKPDMRPVYNVGPYAIKISHISFSGALWQGDLHYIDLQRTALRGRISGDATPIPLDQDEGIVSAASFLYDPRLNVLALEKQSTGITPSRFALYFEKINIVLGTLELKVIIKKDAYEQFRQMDKVTKLRAKIAGGVRGRSLKKQNEHGLVGQAMDLAESVDAPHIDITFGLGRGKKDRSLNIGKVANIIGKLLNKEPDAEVLVVEVTGKSAEDERAELVNLIQQRIHDLVKLSPNADRIIPYANRLAALHAKLDDRRAELEDMYAPPNSFP